MEISELKDKLMQCLDLIWENDSYLIGNDLNERTFCHRLALYLEQEMKGFNVDCEYNRNKNGSKRIYELSQNLNWKMLNDNVLMTIKDAEKMESKIRSYVTYPDIIVHERGSNKRNLLVIEVKKVPDVSACANVDRNDEQKLCAYTSKADTNDYHYLLGVWLAYQPGKHNKRFFLSYFQNGNCVGHELYPALQ